VIEASPPIDDAVDRFSDLRRRRALEDVDDVAAVVVVDVDNTRSPERASVEGLAACGWIKSGPIEPDRMAFPLRVIDITRLDANDRRVEFATIGGVVI
jgi:hypothetical protein